MKTYVACIALHISLSSLAMQDCNIRIEGNDHDYVLTPSYIDQQISMLKSIEQNSDTKVYGTTNITMLRSAILDVLEYVYNASQSDVSDKGTICFTMQQIENIVQQELGKKRILVSIFGVDVQTKQQLIQEADRKNIRWLVGALQSNRKDDTIVSKICRYIFGDIRCLSGMKFNAE